MLKARATCLTHFSAALTSARPVQGCSAGHCNAQVVLAKHKTVPGKMAALKVVYLQSPDMLMEPEHREIMLRCEALACITALHAVI